jgi:hypothetical protein
MEYHLDHRVRLSQESKHKSLYTWSLQEISETGEQIGSDQIPWEWNLYFSANELRYIKELTIEQESNPDAILAASEGVSATESITAILQSGTTSNGFFEPEASYSMFGTGRQIQDFRLTIRPLTGDGQEDVCDAWGCVSYTSEVDFRTETSPDVLQISIRVSSERFRELRELVNHVRPDAFTIRIGRVSGFYSEWSPSITTRRVKVLTRGSEHKIEVPENCVVNPPRLGKVGEFALTAVRRNTLRLEQKFDLWDEESAPEEAGSEEHISGSEQNYAALSAQLAKIQVAFDKLRWPTWLIVGLLLLLYFK